MRCASPRRADVTTVHFIRHGRRGNSGLSGEGREQALRVARALEGAGIRALYTSPLARAAETAAVVGGVLGLAPRACDLLRERANWGDLPGQSRAEFTAMWERCSRERSLVPELGDSSIDAGRRLERFVSGLDMHGSLAAVTHGGVLADFLRNVFPAAVLESKSRAFARDPYSGQVVRECSITTVRAGGTLELRCIAAAEPPHP